MTCTLGNFDDELLAQYNHAGPRYTSYPTVLEWRPLDPQTHIQALKAASNKDRPLSLYVHLPYCDAQCWFCGCAMKVIPKNQRQIGREEINPYLSALKREISAVSGYAEKKSFSQMHWGGGTPTYLSTHQLADLATHIYKHFIPKKDAELSVEIAPLVTDEEQLKILRECGFNRVSFGVQDFDANVQALLNRRQSVSATHRLIDFTRRMGFTSVNVDLIYGLPEQTRNSFAQTIQTIIELRPDRIACYSYAYVPWLKKPQKVTRAQLPSPEEKLAIWLNTINQLIQAGYQYIGLDHFALPDDNLAQAQFNGTLTRNFQGYSTLEECDIYGFGLSAISSVGDVYLQNSKEEADYIAHIGPEPSPIIRGWQLSAEDRLRRDIIMRILCHGSLDFTEISAAHGIRFHETFADEICRLQTMEKDGLIKLGPHRLDTTPSGRIFSRCVAMVFDQYVHDKNKHQGQRFSQTL